MDKEKYSHKMRIQDAGMGMPAYRWYLFKTLTQDNVRCKTNFLLKQVLGLPLFIELLYCLSCSHFYCTRGNPTFVKRDGKMPPANCLPIPLDDSGVLCSVSVEKVTEALNYTIGISSQIIREQAGIVAECFKRLHCMTR